MPKEITHYRCFKMELISSFSCTNAEVKEMLKTTILELEEKYSEIARCSLEREYVCKHSDGFHAVMQQQWKLKVFYNFNITDIWLH